VYVLHFFTLYYACIEALKYRLRMDKYILWLENNGFPAVNIEKTIFMERAGDDFIIHELFIDDIKTAPTKNALMDEFLEKYSKDSEIMGG
jgi:hypothetical protein